METIQVGKFLFNVRGQQDKEILETEIIKDRYRMPKQMKVAIDIGAHIGGTAMLAAQRGAMVYAYEPNKENFKMLVENVKLNHFEKRIKCFNQAIAAERGKRQLYLNDANTGCHSIIQKTGKSYQVETIKLDDVFALNDLQEIDFLKLDCEGAEYDIITKSLQPTLYKIKQISMEFHADILDKWQLEEMVRWIGYRYDSLEKLYYYFYKK